MKKVWPTPDLLDPMKSIDEKTVVDPFQFSPVKKTKRK